ncbi:S1C family serine protease [Thermopirellula anaerolimosa]
MRSAESRSLKQVRGLALVLFTAIIAYGAVAAHRVGLATEDQPVIRIQSLDDARELESHVTELVAKVLPSVVCVRVGTNQGSGVIVTEDGYVLTAGHVVTQPNQRAEFIFADGKRASGTTLGRNEDLDAGLLKLEGDGPWTAAPMGDSDALSPGDWVLALGHPLGYTTGRPPVLRLGRVLRSDRTLIRTDCPLVAGDSGGPLFDLEGRVVGIHSRISTATTTNFHVPVQVFRDGWDRLAKGEVWRDSLPLRDSDAVKQAFASVTAGARDCVVLVRCGDKDVAWGTIVGPDGWVVTKADELEPPIACRLADGRELPAEIVGLSSEHDVAMLKIDAKGLPELTWRKGEDPRVGQWLISPSFNAEIPAVIGVVAAPRRTIPLQPGVLGVSLRDTESGPSVTQVLEDTAAFAAGIKAGDIVLSVDGIATEKSADVVRAIRNHRPGEKITLKLRRGEEQLEIQAVLKPSDTPDARKRRMQNTSGVGVSRRADDYPAVLQHDGVLPPKQCGGPVVDLEGRVVGINIARAGRTETFVLPADVLLGLMYDLMSGRLRPREATPSEEEAKPVLANEPPAEASPVPTQKEPPAEEPAPSTPPEDESTPEGSPKPPENPTPANPNAQSEPMPE